jgi:hypothetical protein
MKKCQQKWKNNLERIERNLFIYGSTDLCWAFAAFFSFLIFYTVGRIPWMGDDPVASRYLTQDSTNTESTHTAIYALSGIRTHDPSVCGGTSTAEIIYI